MSFASALALPEVSISALIERYAVLLLDAYGVLVHSTGVLPGGPELIDRLNRERKPYYILTNDASRLAATAARRFQGFGLAIPEERIVTSAQLLRGYFAGHGLAGSRCVVLGPPESRQYVEEAGGRLVAPIDEFDVLVIADEVGFPFFETVNAAVTSIFHRLDREEDIHLVLPNPDVIYPKGEHGFGITSGGVAAMVEAAIRVRYPHRRDLRFARLGKPEAPIFAEALRRSGTRDMVMVGDQLETDIRGARAFGLDAAWVSRGNLRALEAVPVDLRPTYRLSALT